MRRNDHCISAMALAIFSTAPCAADDGPPRESTVFSGEFDGVLRIAADHEGKRLSGYFDDGKCRFAFGGALTPVLLYSARDFGEAYEIEGWNPATPERRFPLQIHSPARGGYQALISLQLGGGDTPTTSKCRWRITLDRANNVSNSYVAVRVVRTSHPRIYDILKAGDPPSLQPGSKSRPARGSAVWAAKTFSNPFSPQGFVSISWYPDDGPPRGSYIREHDLYPLPADVP
jgi:hypothetical protein